MCLDTLTCFGMIELLVAVCNQVVQSTLPGMEPTDMAPLVADSTTEQPGTGYMSQGFDLRAQVDGVKAKLLESISSWRGEFRGELGSITQSLNELSGRVEILEARSQVVGLSRLENLARLENMGSSNSEMSMKGCPEQTMPEQHQSGLLRTDAKTALTPQVEVFIAEALAGARSLWMDEVDEKLTINEQRRAEMGAKLVKEFERSIVARHAERLATAELKLRTLTVDVEGLQSQGGSRPTSEATNSPWKLDDIDPEDETREKNHCNAILASNLQDEQVSLASDMEMLRADMNRLVAIDLNTVLCNLQELQKQSVGVMTMVEQTKIGLQNEVHARLQENQRMELHMKHEIRELKDRLMSDASQGQGQLGRHSDRSHLQMIPGEFQSKVQQIVNGNLKTFTESSPEHFNLQSILSSDLVTLSSADDDQRPEEVQPNATNSCPSSTCDGTIQSRSSLSRAEVQRHHECPQTVTAELRNTVLAYLHSEFQDHVTEVLKGLQHSPPFSATPSNPPPLDMQETVGSHVMQFPAERAGTYVGGSSNFPVHPPSAPAIESGGSFSVPFPITGNGKLALTAPSAPVLESVGSLSVPFPGSGGGIRSDGGSMRLSPRSGGSNAGSMRVPPPSRAPAASRAPSASRAGSPTVAGSASLPSNMQSPCSLTRTSSPTRPASVSVSVAPPGNTVIPPTVQMKQVSPRASSPRCVVRHATYPSASMAPVVLQQASILTTPRSSLRRQ